MYLHLAYITPLRKEGSLLGFEWDETKRNLNIKKHGFDFPIASRIWDGAVVERIDDRRDYGEMRFQAFGIIENLILTVVYTPRGANRRIISARKANSREKKFFENEIRRRGRARPD